MLNLRIHRFRPDRALALGLGLLLAILAWALPAAAQAPITVWAKKFGGGSDLVNAAVGDASGNVYVIGYMSSATMDVDGETLTRVSPVRDILVVKLNAGGDKVWAKNFGGSAVNTVAEGTAIAVDSTGAVYLAGSFSFGGINVGGTSLTLVSTSADLLVAKLNPDGTTAWAKNFGGAPASVGTHITLDGANNPIVMGYMSSMSATYGSVNLSRVGNTDTVIAKLDSTAGTVTWAKNFSGAGAYTMPLGIGVDTAGDLYAYGHFQGGSVTFGTTPALALDGGTKNLWHAKLDSTGTPVWANRYGGLTVETDGNHALAVDGNGNSHLIATFPAGDIDVGGTTVTGVGIKNLLVAKVDNTGATTWAKGLGTSGAYISGASVFVDGSSNIFFSGYFGNGNLTIGTTALTKAGFTDVVMGSLDSDGEVRWAKNYGGTSAQMTAAGMALTGTSDIVLAGTFSSGDPRFGTTTLTRGAGNAWFVTSQQPPVALAITPVTGTGTITSSPAGINCGSTCTGYYASGASVTLTATPGSGYEFTSWSGDCTGTTTTATVTMGTPQTCSATFTAIGGGGPNPPNPPGPTPAPTPIPASPPAFVSATNPPPAVIGADTTGAGQGTLSFASSFTDPASLSFTAAQTSGAALPAWLTFDPATVSFNYNVPLPADLPIQPTADLASDAAARAVRAGRSIVNTVYPLSVLVQTIPVSLTASGNGQSYTATINMDFYAPRSPVAITAISYGATGASGDAASGRPALSWDGGQVVFQTAAGNINPAVSGAYASIARYHGLSGRRDLLSQSAIPGGGVANGADGHSNNPAVALSGSHAAFSSMAPGLSLTPNNRLRQIYRTGLGYPRVPLNEAATPAAAMVSTTAAGVAADAAADLPSIAEHGGFIAFESAAGNLGRNPDRLSQIWRKDVGGGAVVLVSSAADGAPGNGDSRNVSLSADGNVAVFDSTATNLATGGSGRQIFYKVLSSGAVYRLGEGQNPKLAARGDSVVYVSTNGGTKLQVMRYDIASGATTVVSATPAGVAGNGDSTQPAVSADGRFVVFRSTATDLIAGHAGNGQPQIWIRDVSRGATALVTQTEAGAPGNGASSDPAISGDGAQVAFTSLARDLVRGNPLPGQIHLAANPLVLPGRTGYWYTTDGGNLTWSVERWGDKALIAGLAYAADGGMAVWAAGTCTFSGLTCQGSVSQFAQGGAASTPVGPVGVTFTADGTRASVVLGGAAARSLALYPVGGTRTTGFAGLPQNGYWGVAGNAAGVTSLFIDTDTQVGSNGASVQAMHVTLFGYDGQGNAQWYAAAGNLAADGSFTGQLYLYGGGSSWAQAGGKYWPSATAVGQIRLNFQAADRATAQLPDGRSVTIDRWRF